MFLREVAPGGDFPTDLRLRRLGFPTGPLPEGSLTVLPRPTVSPTVRLRRRASPMPTLVRVASPTVRSEADSRKDHPRSRAARTDTGGTVTDSLVSSPVRPEKLRLHSSRGRRTMRDRAL